jgi:hypothetical protein
VTITAPADAGARVSTSGRAITTVAVIVYTWFFTRWSLQRFNGYGTAGAPVALAAHTQGLWLLGQLEAPFTTLLGRNLFGDHASFAVAALAPAVWVFSSAKVLLVAQTTALAAAAVVVFALGRAVLRDEWAAALVSVAFLAQPALGAVNLEAYRADVLGVPLVLGLVLCAVQRRWIGYFACLALLLLVREEAAVLGAAVGVGVAVWRNRAIGLWAVTVAAAWFALAIAVLRLLNGEGLLHGFGAPLGPDGLAAVLCAIAAIAALSRVAPGRRVSGAAGIVVLALGAGWLGGPASIARSPAPLGDPQSALAVAADTALDMIPSGAAVAADERFLPHLARRRAVFEFPLPWYVEGGWGRRDDPVPRRLPEADAVVYVLVEHERLGAVGRQVLLEVVEREFDLLYEGGPVRLYRRISR